MRVGRHALESAAPLAVLALACLCMLFGTTASAQTTGGSLPVKIVLENMPAEAELVLEFFTGEEPAPLMATTFAKAEDVPGQLPEVEEAKGRLAVTTGPGRTASPVHAEAMVGLSAAKPAKTTVRVSLPGKAVLTLTPFESPPLRITRGGTYQLGE